MPDEEHPGQEDAKKNSWLALLVVGYAGVVHLVDTLAVYDSPLTTPWGVFQWRFSCGFDLFKFIFWFVIPFVFSLRRMDWGYFGLKRWRRIDLMLLLGLVFIGLGAVLVTQHIPALRALYPSLGRLSPEDKWDIAQTRLIWTASWLIGWEFLHRYVLVTSLRRPVPVLLIVPLVEGLYHVGQKPAAWLEALGMVALSVLFCAWTLRRRNIGLPFLAHLFIELELLAFQLLL